MTETGRRSQSDLDLAIARALEHPALVATPRLAPDLSLIDRRYLQQGLDSSQITPKPGLLIGLFDRPRELTQDGLFVDLSLGGLMVGGPIGSGRTTGLATLLSSFDSRHPDGLALLIDAAGGSLHQKCAPAGDEDPALLLFTAEEVGPITLAIDKLANHLSTDRLHENRPILIIVDGFGEFLASLARARALAWLERLARLVVRGRSQGLWFACSVGDQRDVGVEMRGALRHVIELGARPKGRAIDDGNPPTPGRGVDRINDEIQLFLPLPVRQLPGAPEVKAALSDVPWPLTQPTSDEGAAQDRFLIGQEHIDFETVSAELGLRSLLVLGPPRSGKTAVLRSLLVSFPHAAVIAGRGERPWLARMKELRSSSPSISANEEYASAVLAEIFSETAQVAGKPLIAVDDGHLLRNNSDFKDFVETALAYQMAAFVITADLGSTSAYDWKLLIDQSSQVLFLCPSQASEVDDGARILQDSLRLRPGYNFRQGTGVFYDRRAQYPVTCFWVPPAPSSKGEQGVNGR